MPTNVPISVTLAFNLTGVQFQPNGDFIHTFTCTDPSGAIKKIKSYVVKGDGSGVYDLDNGTQLAASSTTRASNLAGYKTNVDSDMAAAQVAGKIVF